MNPTSKCNDYGGMWGRSDILKQRAQDRAKWLASLAKKRGR